MSHRTAHAMVRRIDERDSKPKPTPRDTPATSSSSTAYRRRPQTFFFFFFNDTPPPEIYSFPLPDAFPISDLPLPRPPRLKLLRRGPRQSAQSHQTHIDPLTGRGWLLRLLPKRQWTSPHISKVSSA